MPKKAKPQAVLMELVERRIHLIRNQKVMLDRDLAELYEVRTIPLRQQFQRNRDRFPGDFVIQLTRAEAELLVSQNVIPSRRSLGGALPYAFTEQGVAMLSSVLTRKRPLAVNIAIMRAFVRIREMVGTHKEIIRKIDAMEEKYDDQFRTVFTAIRRLIDPPSIAPKRRIGFTAIAAP